MKSKLVLWGNDANNDRILIAMQLRSTDNKVETWLFPEGIASPEFSQQMLTNWRNGAEIPFPEGFTHTERELSLTDSLLPDDIKVDRPDIINRAQTEWQFVVLSTKLHESYKSELADLDDKVHQLTDYSGDLFNSLKNFWVKVQDQVKERNLFRDHADELRDTTNVLFGKLKDMRSTVMNEFEENSKSLYDQFNTVLDEIEKKVAGNIQRFPEMFDQLKHTQTQFRDKKMTRDHSNELWTRIDTLFKTLKEKRFGVLPTNDDNPAERLARRYEGLLGACDKMQESIERDQQELDFQKKRVANSEGQLEAQIRQAKINIIQERVNSKIEKLAEMAATKNEVEAKMVAFKAKEARKEAENAEKRAKTKEDISNKTDMTSQPATAPKMEVTAPVVKDTSKEQDNVKAVDAPAMPKIITKLTPSVIEAVQPILTDNHDALNAITADAHAAIEAVGNL